MSIKSSIARLLPRSTVRGIGRYIAQKDLQRIPSVSCSVENLRTEATIVPHSIFDSVEIATVWRDAEIRLQQFSVSTSAGGVNLGDRRALFFLTYALAPRSTLEIGTHIGASMIHIAEAMRIRRPAQSDSARLVTVDVLDVNSAGNQPRGSRNVALSPAKMISRLGLSEMVRFVTQDSLAFLDSCTDRFDFVFLDGSHTAATVYQEIPRALARLNPGSVILLHDYFPSLRPLWPNGYVIPGPALAVRRLQDEGLPLVAMPLGDLPWPTKLGTHRTSLALLARSEE